MPKSRDENKSIQGKTDMIAQSTDASGIFTWVIAADTIYSDSLVAEIFGFDPLDARRGMPLNEYLIRIHPDDLPRVAKAIHDTMLSSQPFNEQYRVCRPDGSIMEIVAVASCFHDAAHEPSHYSGVIFPHDADSAANTVLHHLLAAHDLASRTQNTVLAGKIIDALAEIGWREDDDDLVRPARYH